MRKNKKQREHLRSIKTKRGKKRILVNRGNRKKLVLKKFKVASKDDINRMSDERKFKLESIFGKLDQLESKADMLERKGDLEGAKKARNRVESLEDKWMAEDAVRFRDEPVILLEDNFKDPFDDIVVDFKPKRNVVRQPKRLNVVGGYDYDEEA